MDLEQVLMVAFLLGDQGTSTLLLQINAEGTFQVERASVGDIQ